MDVLSGGVGEEPGGGRAKNGTPCSGLHRRGRTTEFTGERVRITEDGAFAIPVTWYPWRPRPGMPVGYSSENGLR